MPRVMLPRTLDECWQILATEPGAALYAGGTDLLVKLRAGQPAPRVLVCIERVDALHGVYETEGGLFVAAATTHTALLAHPTVRTAFPVLTQALSVLGSPPIRNMGTIGGNIVTASPAGDTLPPLYALEADVEVRSRDNTRRIPLRDFVIGPGKVALARDEILTGVLLEKRPQWHVQRYEKVGRRKALACSVVSMAALLQTSADGTVMDARLAWGSVGPTVIRSRMVEEALLGKPLSMEALRAAGALVRQVVQPIDDLRAGAEYRRQVSANLLLRLVDA